MKVKTLITKLGGAPAVAKALSAHIEPKTVSAGTVYRWCDRGTISYRWRPLMAQVVAAHGLTLPAELALFAPSKAAE